MIEAVLDASALLALLNGEPGAEAVEPLLNRAAVSSVNLCEVASRLVDRGLDRDEVREVLGVVAVAAVHEFDRTAAELAAELRRSVPYSLSLGDRACMALAQVLGVPAVTADRGWMQVQAGVEVRLIR